MSGKIIPFRLRQRKDDDLSEAIDSMPEHLDNSDVIREALRMYFFNAPTPLRDAYIRNEFAEAPKRILNIPPPQISLPIKTTVTPTVVSTDNFDDKLNKILGF